MARIASEPRRVKPARSWRESQERLELSPGKSSSRRIDGALYSCWSPEGLRYPWPKSGHSRLGQRCNFGSQRRNPLEQDSTLCPRSRDSKAQAPPGGNTGWARGALELRLWRKSSPGRMMAAAALMEPGRVQSADPGGTLRRGQRRAGIPCLGTSSWSGDGTLLPLERGGEACKTLEGQPPIGVEGGVELGSRTFSPGAGRHTASLSAEGERPVGAFEGHIGRVTGALELGFGDILSWSTDGTLRFERGGRSLKTPGRTF